MKDPARWLDDAETPPELRELLSGAERPRDLDGATRSRLGARVARLAVPISVAAWLSVKSAAAIGIAAGLISAGAGLGVSTYLEQTEPQETPRGASAPQVKRDQTAPDVASAPPALNPAPTLPLPEPEPPPAVRSAAPARSGGLAEESTLLERARRSLGESPAQALALVREHERSFPRGQLASERSLVELEALYSLGQHGKARALAERLLAAGGDDLYRARIQRLRQKIDSGQ